MDNYVYYSKGTNHDGADDVAITEAESLEIAVDKFRKYYKNATETNVSKVDFNRKGYVQGVMIVSNY